MAGPSIKHSCRWAATRQLTVTLMTKMQEFRTGGQQIFGLAIITCDWLLSGDNCRGRPGDRARLLRVFLRHAAGAAGRPLALVHHGASPPGTTTAKPGSLTSSPELLYRTDFFPGLGWMLTKELWQNEQVQVSDYWKANKIEQSNHQKCSFKP